jgi:hypothetical protein
MNGLMKNLIRILVVTNILLTIMLALLLFTAFYAGDAIFADDCDAALNPDITPDMTATAEAIFSALAPVITDTPTIPEAISTMDIQTAIAGTLSALPTVTPESPD